MSLPPSSTTRSGCSLVPLIPSNYLQIVQHLLGPRHPRCRCQYLRLQQTQPHSRIWNYVRRLAICRHHWHLRFHQYWWQSRDVVFDILTTTRNTRLDELTRGQSLGTTPIDEGLAKTRLKFGLLVNSDGGMERAGFGLAEEVRTLKNFNR